MTGECQNLRPDCPYIADCHSSVHHLFYPKNQYKSTTEKTFRDLPDNKVMMCRDDHDQLHFNEQPPEKPSHHIMALAIATSGVYLSVAKKRDIGLP